ncbi:guanine nucleotide-binding protein subunit alpha [Chytriomyces hyalinus]|nr:guanine nucleotide-binding protein subunit alpha [Chytriomyces hyalinus]
MGSCNSNAAHDAAKAASSKIDSQLRQEETVFKRTAKLLLLGAGETGKSTVLKQMKLMHNIPFTEMELNTYRAGMVLNLVTCAKTLIQAMDKLQIPYGFDSDSAGFPPESIMSDSQLADSKTSLSNKRADLSTQKLNGRPEDPHAKYARDAYVGLNHGKNQTGPAVDAAKYLKDCDISFCFGGGNTVPEEVVNAIKVFWEDSGVQYCFSRASEYQLMDSCSYVMSHPIRICSTEYKPTEEDILQVRIMTLKINEAKFYAQGTPFHVVDVGGQRSERKKWIPYFEDARAIIYMVALSSYDQMCFEDSITNRITESLTLFHTVTHHPLLKDTCIILFLNKIDLFKAKLQDIPVANWFPDYKGDNDYASASRYFESRFRSENTYSKRTIFTHFTWATDKEQISNIIASVLVSVTKAVLEELGMM